MKGDGSGMAACIENLGRDKGSHWEGRMIPKLFPGVTYCRQVMIDPNEDRTVYLATGVGGGSAMSVIETGSLFCSRDLGESWFTIGLCDNPTSLMYQVALNSKVSINIDCGNRDGSLYSSYDRGRSWSRADVAGEISRSCHVYLMTCG